jgi:hypothetical protein
VQQYDEALQEQDLCRTWPPSVRELVTCQRGELDRIVSASSQVELPTRTSLSAAPSSRPESQQNERYNVESATDNLAEDVPEDILMRGARHGRSDRPEEAVSQKSIEKDPRAESSFLDVLPNLVEMRKQHCQLHSARSANNNPRRSSKDVYEVPQVEPRREPPRPAGPATSTRSRVPAPKKKLALVS